MTKNQISGFVAILEEGKVKVKTATREKEATLEEKVIIIKEITR